MYALTGVWKSYGKTPVLRDLSCRFPSDEFGFIMGPSGAGKSTLLRLLSFVEVPDDGIIRLNLDSRLYESSGRARPWPRLTCVFQRQFLWPHLTLRENIALPVRMVGLPDAKTRVGSVIDLFNMQTFIDRYPNEVSGGQAQRAALARALALDPKVILIDEAHGGLDLEQQQILNGHLLKLRESGVGLLIVTHDIAFARRYADHVVIVDDGRIVEFGSRSTFENPRSTFLRRTIGAAT